MTDLRTTSRVRSVRGQRLIRGRTIPFPPLRRTRSRSTARTPGFLPSPVADTESSGNCFRRLISVRAGVYGPQMAEMLAPGGTGLETRAAENSCNFGSLDAPQCQSLPRSIFALQWLNHSQPLGFRRTTLTKPGRHLWTKFQAVPADTALRSLDRSFVRNGFSGKSMRFSALNHCWKQTHAKTDSGWNSSGVDVVCHWLR